VLSSAKVEAFLNRARAAFRRTPHSPYLSGYHIPEDFDNLGLHTFEDQSQAVWACLQELTSAFYDGPNPPDHIGCEPVCKDERLLQFVWSSGHFRGRRMCFKFAIKSKRQSDERLSVVRLHDPYDPNWFAKRDKR
jgi:hypothetical protein